MAFMNARKRNKMMTYVLVGLISVGLLASVSIYWTSGSSYSGTPNTTGVSVEAQAVQDFSDGSALLGQSGKEKEGQEKLTSAIKGFEQVLKKNPKNLPVLGDLATANFYMGNVDKAIELANQALKIDPNYSVVRVNLARYLFYGKNNGDAAAAELKKIAKSDSFYQNAQDLLSEINKAPKGQSLPSQGSPQGSTLPAQGNSLPPQGQTLPPKN